MSSSRRHAPTAAEPAARGLYETLITDALAGRLAALDERDHIIRHELRAAEAADRLALYLGRVVARALAGVEDDERVDRGVALARAGIGASREADRDDAGPGRPCDPSRAARQPHDGLILACEGGDGPGVCAQSAEIVGVAARHADRIAPARGLSASSDRSRLESWIRGRRARAAIRHGDACWWPGRAGAGRALGGRWAGIRP